MRKKKIVYHSNSCWSKTGFGRHSRELLTSLYKTGKYDIVEYAAGVKWNDFACRRTPWPCFGVWPDNDAEIAHVLDHPQKDAIMAHIRYGSHNVDKIIEQEKPDVYIGTEDFWAFHGYWDRKWWNKLTNVIHTTLDSLPLYGPCVQNAPKVKNLLVWAKFAEDEFQRLAQAKEDELLKLLREGCKDTSKIESLTDEMNGMRRVKTVHGAIDHKLFHKMSAGEKMNLRDRHKIDKDAYVIGFVFRNQLRKQVEALIEAVAQLKGEKANAKFKALLHTNFEETERGWNIPDLAKRHGLDSSDILATYVCRSCNGYAVKPYTRSEVDCEFCGAKANNDPRVRKPVAAQATPGTDIGVTEKQLNEIYNLMDVYAHPFSSGGQEIPVQEAKLCELITLVTNYSCGTEYCTEESGGLPLEWAKYLEHGSQFIKASTSSASIRKQILKVTQMDKQKREEMGRNARKFVINTCSTEVVSRQFQDLIDNAPLVDWSDFQWKQPECNPDFKMPTGDIPTEDFIRTLYREMLKRDPDPEGFEHWKGFLANPNGPSIQDKRAQMHAFFIKESASLNDRNNPKKVEAVFDDNGRKKACMVMPRSLGDCYLITSLFASFREQYPDYDLYIATSPEYFPIFQGNEYVYKVIPYHPNMEDELFLLGRGPHKGLVDICFLPHVNTQKHQNYLRNGNDSFAYELYSK